jgi:hypothetical protein
MLSGHGHDERSPRLLARRRSTAALVPTIIVRHALLAHLYEGSFKEIGWAYSFPDSLTPAWFGEVAIASGWAFLCVLPGTLLFLAIVKRLERGEAREAWEWALAGAVGAIPLAIGLCILVGRSLHGPMGFLDHASLAGGSIALCGAIGAWGGLAARRFRHRPDWSNAL